VSPRHSLLGGAIAVTEAVPGFRGQSLLSESTAKAQWRPGADGSPWPRRPAPLLTRPGFGEGKGMTPQPSPVSPGDTPPERLPRGRHRLPFEYVVENQRRRLLTGTATALAEQGFAALTVKHIIEAAGVSRTTFYANFDNKQDAVLAAHSDAFQRLLSAIVGGCAGEREWPQKVRAAIAAAFALLTDEPSSARLLTLNSVAADMTIGRQVRDSNAHLATLLREGRRHTLYGPTLPDLVEEGLIGAFAGILCGRVLDSGKRSFAVLQSELTQLALTPYIGMPEAARVAADPPSAVPPLPPQASAGVGDD
jgi:AcrR family transcriptional regulator